MSSSTPLVYQQPPPPLLEVTQKAYTTHSANTSVGPLIAALVVITVLGVVAAVVGRLCSGKEVMGIGHYDFEGWAERKCGTCIDGGIAPPPSERLQVPFPESGEAGTAVAGGDVEEQKPPDGKKNPVPVS